MKQQVMSFDMVPKEIKSIIRTSALDTSQITYNMHVNQSHEKLLIPYTLRPINPVKAIYAGQLRPDDIIAKPGDTILFDIQLWYKVYWNSYQLRLDQDTLNTDDYFCCPRSQCHQETQAWFDGINRHKKALFAQGSFGQTGDYDIFLLNQSKGLMETIEHQERLKPLCKGKGSLCSIMLHPVRNIILFSVAHTHIEEKVPLPYSVSIVEFDENDKQKNMRTTYTDTLFKKIIYLGCNTYLGLTNTSILAILWHNNDNHFIYKEQKHQSRFIDIAVDESRQTQRGFKPYVACLSTNGDLFVSDIRAFDKPTLFLTKKIPNHQQAFRLFYDKTQCAVLYKAPEDGINYTDFLVWPDNFGIHYINKVLGLVPRATHNKN